MAAKKSIPKKSGSHHGRTKEPRRRAALRRRTHSPGRLTEPCIDCEPSAKIAQQIREPDDVVELLSNRLALVETAGLALREYEEQPGVGSICTALEQALDLLGRAHEAVNLYLQGMRLEGSRANDPSYRAATGNDGPDLR